MEDAATIADPISSVGHPSTPLEVQQRLQSMAGPPYKAYLSRQGPAQDETITGVIGMITPKVHTCNEPIDWVMVLVVHPDHRRRGIGNQLLRHAEQHLEQEGARLVQLFSSIGNTDTHEYYRHIGYTPQAFRLLKVLKT